MWGSVKKKSTVATIQRFERSWHQNRCDLEEKSVKKYIYRRFTVKLIDSSNNRYHLVNEAGIYF